MIYPSLLGAGLSSGVQIPRSMLLSKFKHRTDKRRVVRFVTKHLLISTNSLLTIALRSDLDLFYLYGMAHKWQTPEKKLLSLLSCAKTFAMITLWMVCHCVTSFKSVHKALYHFCTWKILHIKMVDTIFSFYWNYGFVSWIVKFHYLSLFFHTITWLFPFP